VADQINPINPEIARLFRARLQEGETILWQSQTDPLAAARSGAVSGGAAVCMLLLGMFWLRILLKIGFNHPAALLNPSLWSPFVLVAAVLAWGAWSAYRKALRTGYAVTNRRLLLALDRSEPIFSGREREAWGYSKLSVAASGVGTVTLAAAANAGRTTYDEVRNAAGLFNFVVGNTGGTGQPLLPPHLDPVQLFLARDERVLWQSEADQSLLARALRNNALLVVLLMEGIVALLTSVPLGITSQPPIIYFFCYSAFLVLGIASWVLIPLWAGRKAARTAADQFYALTDRRLVIARRTSRTDIVQFALDRLEVRESIPGQHKIRLRTAQADDPEMVHVADADGVYARLTAAVSRAKQDNLDSGRASAPVGTQEPDIPGEDPFSKQLRRGEEILWRGNSKGGGRQMGNYALEMFARAALFIVAFPLVMGTGGVGWGVAGGCFVLAALVMLSIATTAWGSIRSQEYAITADRLLIVKKTSDRKRHFLQADIREPVNITMTVNPKTGLGTFEIACREADAAFAESDGRVRRLSLSLLSVADPVRVYNLLTAAHLAHPVPQSVLNGEADHADPFAPFLRPAEVMRWQGRPEPPLADGGMRWNSDRFLSPVWAMVWVGLLLGAGHLGGYGWPTAALRVLPFTAFALAARYQPKRQHPAGACYTLTDQRLFSLDRTHGLALSDLDLGRVERIATVQKRGDTATFVFLVGENSVRWEDAANADAVYRQVDGAVAKARAGMKRSGTPD